MVGNVSTLHILGLGVPESFIEGEKPCHAMSPVLSHSSIKTAGALIAGKEYQKLIPNFSGQRIVIGKDINQALTEIKRNRQSGIQQVALSSGDPMFYGLGTTLLTYISKENVYILPGISSLQATCAFLGKPFLDIIAISLHGRNAWHSLQTALKKNQSIFLLTDSKSTPDKVATFLLHHGYEHLDMHILENLHILKGTITAEYYEQTTVIQGLSWSREKDSQRVIFLEHQPSTKKEEPYRYFGLSDELFSKETSVFTKSPIRAVCLSKLEIKPNDIIWDLGSGSGSVAIEASRLAYEGTVYAVEKKKERFEQIKNNINKFCASNVIVFNSKLPWCLPDQEDIHKTNNEYPLPFLPLPVPDKIFIGGGLSDDSSKLLINRAWSILKVHGIVVINCVLLSSLELVRKEITSFGVTPNILYVQCSTSIPLGSDMYLQGMNPTYIITAKKN